MAEACYLHTSLYTFNATARASVITAFNEAIQDAAAKCWYDAGEHAFCIECPASLGHAADEALAHIVPDYIERELGAAERDARPPDVTRLAESRFDDLDTTIDILEERTESHDPDPGKLASAPRPTSSHIVVVDGSEGKLVKLFSLSDLDNGFLERTLVPVSSKAENVLTTGLTCRSVRRGHGDNYVFNGRTGRDDKDNLHMTNDSVELPAFRVMDDSRETEPEPLDSAVSTWVHVGEAPSVAKWVQGIGQTMQVDPDARPEMSKDAKQHIASANNSTVGRARVPRGEAVLSVSDEEDDRKGDDVAQAEPVLPFGALLQPGRQGCKATGSDSNESQDDGEVNIASPTFEALLGQSEGAKKATQPARQSTMGDWNALRTPNQQTSPFAAKLPIPMSASHSTTPLPQIKANAVPLGQQHESRSCHQSMQHDRARTPTSLSMNKTPINELPSANSNTCFWSSKQFASVDDEGLYAPPTEQAKWQSEHYETNKRRPKLLRRARDTGSSEASPVNSDNTVLMHGHPRSRASVSTSTARVAEVRSQLGDVRPGEMGRSETFWASKTVEHRVQTARLVEDRTNISPRIVSAPPGYHALKETMVASRQGARVESDTAEPLLIDVAENVLEVKSVAPLKGLLNVHTALQPARSSSVQAVSVNEEDDAIVERVQSLPVEYSTKRNTMRQKARKKTKSKGGVKAANKAKTVQLPLPDPVPQTKRKQAAETSKQKISTSTNAKEAANTERGKAEGIPVAFPVPLPASSLLSSDHAFGQALSDYTSHIQQESDQAAGNTRTTLPTKLTCQIGTLLVRGVSKSLTRRILEPAVLQVKLNEMAGELKGDLLERLSTSTADGKALMMMLLCGVDTCEWSAKTSYCIFVRDAAGSYMVVEVPSEGKSAYTVKSLDNVVAEAYAHYPTRVFDAKYRLIVPGSEAVTPSAKAIQEFVSTMDTGDEAPAFRAMARPGLVTPLKVLARRVFTNTFGGITSNVTQVQELYLESSSGKYYNWHATAPSEDHMVEGDRLWWEASLETDIPEKADELQARVTDVIWKMDGVGINNYGPYSRNEEEVQEEDAVSRDADGAVPW